MKTKHLFQQFKIFVGCVSDSVTHRQKFVKIWQGAATESVMHREGFWESVQRFREEENIEATDIDPDEIFKDVRDPSPGRDIVL